MKKTYSVDIGGKSLTFETGRFAKQADGAVFTTYGDISILATAQMSNPRGDMDFFPLLVDFEAKFYATGKMKGSRFSKREARPPDSAILASRLIDRSLRPLFPKGMRNDVQIITTMLQSDEIHTVNATAINAASMAVQLSGMPIEAPIGSVRVGMRDNGEYFLDPNFDEVKDGKLDLIVAGKEDAIMMIEAGANLITEEEMIKALEFAHKEIKKICAAQKEFRAQFEIEEKIPVLVEENLEAKEAVDKFLSEKDFDSISGKTKKEIKQKTHELEEKLFDHYSKEIEEEKLAAKNLKKYFEKNFAKSLRRRALVEKKRIDDRKVDEVRPISVEVGVLPRLHGSALFQRGETQALSITTVGGPSDEKIVDNPEQPEFKKSYIHHYNFPPFSVGEIRPMRGPGRREIGHGELAARALRYVVPTKEKDNFPYVLRVVSEILACNGSSSMASVCGSTLSLMDAGIKIKAPVAGIAMGLFMDPDSGEYEILTDIQGFEDFDGDMDFKVAGDEERITAVQMDIKVKGLKIELLKEAFERARIGRSFILSEMKKVIKQPKKDMSNYAPRVYTIKIKPEYIRSVIGKGGETIQKMTEEFDVDINIEDSGLIFITSKNKENAEKAKKAIELIAYEPNIGDIFDNATVKSVKDFGAFVEFLPGKEALVHASEISNEYVKNVSDYLKEGQKVKVKIVGQDDIGRIKLSMKNV